MDLLRTGLDMSIGRWKSLLIALTLFSVTLMVIEGVAAAAAFTRGTTGELGIQREATWHEGHQAWHVRGFEAWSRAPQVGVRVGDLMRFDRWYDLGREYQPGETVGFTVVREGLVRAVRVPVVKRPIAGLDHWHFWANAVLCGLGTLLGLVIGLRQAEVTTSRALALAFLWWSANLSRGYALPDLPAAVTLMTQDAALVPGWALGAWFAIHYPDQRPTGLRAVLRRGLPLMLVVLLPVELVVVAARLGWATWDWFWWATTPYVGAAGLLMLLAFWDGWRHSSGELRQRFSWLLGSFALMWSVSYLTWMSDWFGNAKLDRWISFGSVVGSLLALLGLTYAILRHRVLDMGLALNRSLVFTVVGAALLGSFHFLNVLAGRLLHFDDPAKAGLLSAALAALVVLAYPKVKPRAEWLVDRLFFAPWVAREADLSRFAADARGYTAAPALGLALVGALDRFTSGAGAALFVRQRDGGFARQPGATLDAPDQLPADEPLAVALRAGHAVARREAVHSALPGELAIAFSRPRELEAFVLVGAQNDGGALRSDEVAALREALQAAGSEWHALRWAALQRHVAH